MRNIINIDHRPSDQRNEKVHSISGNLLREHGRKFHAILGWM